MIQTKLDVNRDFYNLDQDGEVLLYTARKGMFYDQLDGKKDLCIYEPMLKQLGIQADMTREQIVGCLNDLLSPDNEKVTAVVNKEVERQMMDRYLGLSKLEAERERLSVEVRAWFNRVISKMKEFCEAEDEQ